MPFGVVEAAPHARVDLHQAERRAGADERAATWPPSSRTGASSSPATPWPSRPGRGTPRSAPAAGGARRACARCRRASGAPSAGTRASRACRSGSTCSAARPARASPSRRRPRSRSGSASCRRPRRSARGSRAARAATRSAPAAGSHRPAGAAVLEAEDRAQLRIDAGLVEQRIGRILRDDRAGQLAQLRRSGDAVAQTALARRVHQSVRRRRSAHSAWRCSGGSCAATRSSSGSIDGQESPNCSASHGPPRRWPSRASRHRVSIVEQQREQVGRGVLGLESWPARFTTAVRKASQIWVASSRASGGGRRPRGALRTSWNCATDRTVGGRGDGRREYDCAHPIVNAASPFRNERHVRRWNRIGLLLRPSGGRHGGQPSRRIGLLENRDVGRAPAGTSPHRDGTRTRPFGAP